MVTKKSVTAKPKSEAAAPKKASPRKSVEKDMGAGAAMAARSKDAAAAKRTTKASSAKMDSAKPGKEAAAKKAKAARTKVTSANPSLAKRVIRKVKSAAGGVASLAGAVVGKS